MSYLNIQTGPCYRNYAGTREHISRAGMVEVQSASSFHKLVHSQVITMKTLKEDTEYDIDKLRL